MQAFSQDINNRAQKTLRQKQKQKYYKRREPAECRSKSTHVANTRLDEAPEAPKECKDERTTQKKRW
jgi:hypothetical protein